LLSKDVVRNGEIICPDFYAQYGVEFAEAMACELLMPKEIEPDPAVVDQTNIVPLKGKKDV